MNSKYADMFTGIKAVLFDLDGTLVSSMHIWKDIDIEFLGRFGYTIPEDLQSCIEGMSFYETAAYFKNRFQLPIEIDEIMDAWNQMAFDKYSNEVELKTGVYEFLNYLQKQGYVMGIATSNSRLLATEALKRKGVLSFFSVILTGTDCGAGKPAPDVYLNTAAQLHVNPEECIVFEDLPAGLLAGKRAGMKTVAVDDTYSAYLEQEKRNLSDYYIMNYTELLEDILNEKK